VWVRLVKPRFALARPWRLEQVVAERGETTTLVLKPPPAARFRFEPGQFGWFAIGRSPFSITQHPFSFASSAERDEVELAVKALGDFTSRVRELESGTTVYVDGPHGVFSIDQDEGPGFGFVAGGVGIAGLISMLRTMADREDVRPRCSSTPTASGTGSRFAMSLSGSRTGSPSPSSMCSSGRRKIGRARPAM
jgi:predicted ferric reductase